jgi:superfamily I DNA and/or RNA helicase
MPFLISGPPGTGKTKTIIETILQLLSQSSPLTSDIHILACAPSPSAADTIALRLIKHLKPGQMFRLNDITRTFAEVPDALMLYCHSTDTFFSLPPWEKLMMAQVVVTDCMSSFELIKARCTNRDISAVQDFYRPIFPHQEGSDLKHWHWTHLFIDEAAQAREPESLIPLLVVAPETRPNASIPPKLILAGDSNQLGPKIVSLVARRYGLDISLFERLLKRSVYADHPNARQNIWKRVEGMWYRPAFVNLIRNYRSHSGILMMPSAMFYNSTLLPEARNTTSLTSWNYLTNEKIPVLFVPCADEEMWIPDTAGWYNSNEIKITVTLIQHLLNKENTSGTQVKAAEVAVITPFREHVIRMRKALRKQGLGSVSVGTVENYQGGEMRVTILNCVRSTARFLDWDKQKGRGIVNQRQRFNVAITRAKELLIIIGNPSVLQVLLTSLGNIVDID